MTPLFRPMWLPPVLRMTPMGFDTASTARGLLYYTVTYAATRDGATAPYLTLTSGYACGACADAHVRPAWVLPVRVGSLRNARLFVYRSDPAIMLVWQGDASTYALSARGVNLDDVLRIAANLRPF